jgi:hypothetical protein
MVSSFWVRIRIWLALVWYYNWTVRSFKTVIKGRYHDVSVVGGKGKKSKRIRENIVKLTEENYNLSTSKIDGLLDASKMSA